MIKKDIDFYNSTGDLLAGRLYYKGEISNTGIIFSHGLLSNKDGYKIGKLSEYLVDLGFTLLTFDFSFSGESKGEIENLSVLQEVDDLESAINYINTTGVKFIHLMGSSMGGVVSILASSKNKLNILSLILIATPVNLLKIIKDISEDDIDELPDKGFTEIGEIKIKNLFFKEIKNIDMIEEIKNINIPVLIIHGEKDEIVDFSDAILLQKTLKSFSKLIKIKNGNHTLVLKKNIQEIKENIGEWFKNKNFF
jgi:pimeloyl-ACP methyl ester carboxylesterase